MRQLDLYEVKEKFEEYASDIEYSDWELVHQKLVQFWNFIISQPILNNIIDRISFDYTSTLKRANNLYSGQEGSTKYYLDKIEEKDIHGVFGMFLIQKSIELKNKRHPELDIIDTFHDSEVQHSDTIERYIELIFKPFVELVNWYLVDKKSDSIGDYFTISEAEDIHRKLVEIIDRLEKLEKLPLGQEVIFNEVDDLKELTLSLKKKNWFEILKGKLINMVASEIISIKTFKMIISVFTGDEMKFLED